MFVLDTERVVKWPVVVDVPVDGGELKQQQFEMHFKLVPADELPKATALSELIVGWDGVHQTGEDGTVRPLPFSEGALGMMLAIPYAARAIQDAYIDCFTGARRKNSATPLATGPAATTPAPATMQ